MAIEVYKILNGMCPPVLANIVQKDQVHIILDIQIYYRSRQWVQVHMVRDL